MARDGRVSEAISDSLKRPRRGSVEFGTTSCLYKPGMIYVSERSADSICETELALFETKSSYLPSILRGEGAFCGNCRICLYVLTTASEAAIV